MLGGACAPARLCVEYDSPHYSHEAHNPHLRVFLDGVRQKFVIEYDKCGGWLRRNKVDANGQMVIELGSFVEETVKGVVSVDYEG